MKKSLLLIAAVIAVSLILQGVGTAGLREEEPGVLVDDFADGTLDGWEVPDPEAVFVGMSVDDQPYVWFSGDTPEAMWVQDREFEDFVIEARMRHQHGMWDMGVFFREKCVVSFGGQGRLDMRAPGMRTRCTRRLRDPDKWHTLKLVVAGGVATAYVDGEFAAQLTDVPRKAGMLGLYARQPSYAADVRIDENLRAEDYVGLEPVSDEDALVFDPGKDIPLNIRVRNTHADEQTIPLRLVVRDWERNTLAESDVAQARVPGGGEITQTIIVGGLDEGYYQVVIEPRGVVFPLAVHERPDPTQAARPEVWPGLEGGKPLFGVYWYFLHQYWPDLLKNTYAHAAARDLQRHNFNAVVMTGGMGPDQIEIFARYGIACFSRRGGHMDHPLLAGTFVGDEPHDAEIPRYKAMYQQIRERYGESDKVITTCMIGDGGLAGAEEAWKELLPLGGVRLFRWYGIKREHFGVLHRYGNRPRYLDVLSAARAGYQRDGYPYWIILQSNGSPDAEAYYGQPSGSQTRKMMHLAAAYQAKGIIFYTYQTHIPGRVGMVDGESLLPASSQWSEAGRVAGILGEHADILASLRPTGSLVWRDSAQVEVLHYTDGDEESFEYLYVINKDADNQSEVKIFQLAPGTEIHDLYNGRRITAREETVVLRLGTRLETGAINLTLEPGDGVLLRYARGEAVQSKPVEFPEWVETAREEDTLYLFDIEPSSVPRLGWVARGVMRRENKTMMEIWRWHSAEQFDGVRILYSSTDDVGVAYPKSLYAHADSRIDYDLPPGYTRFVAAAGLSSKGPEADVVFRVYVDDELKFNSGVVAMGDPPQPVIVDITGAKRLTLITEAADFCIRHDSAAWGAARLVKR